MVFLIRNEINEMKINDNFNNYENIAINATNYIISLLLSMNNEY